MKKASQSFAMAALWELAGEAMVPEPFQRWAESDELDIYHIW
jgi:hypothetical protein